MINQVSGYCWNPDWKNTFFIWKTCVFEYSRHSSLSSWRGVVSQVFPSELPCSSSGSDLFTQRFNRSLCCGVWNRSSLFCSALSHKESKTSVITISQPHSSFSCILGTRWFFFKSYVPRKWESNICEIAFVVLEHSQLSYSFQKPDSARKAIEAYHSFFLFKNERRRWQCHTTSFPSGKLNFLETKTVFTSFETSTFLSSFVAWRVYERQDISNRRQQSQNSDHFCQTVNAIQSTADFRFYASNALLVLA